MAFDDTALPAEIEAGDPISGTLHFDQSAYDISSRILGNVFSGNRFHYYAGLDQSISIDEWKWVLDSGKVTLSRSYDTSTKYFSLYTTSTDFGFIEFPNYVGNFELGFALRDDQEPFDIFDTYSLDTATLDLGHVTGRSGHISSRKWDEYGDIIDGYYISFEILEATLKIPEPDPPLLQLAALVTVAALGWARSQMVILP